MDIKKKLTFHIVKKSDFESYYPNMDWIDSESNGLLNQHKIKTIIDYPLRKNYDAPAQILALYGNIIIGKIDILFGEIKIGKSSEKILWLSTWEVGIKFRHMGAGLFMMLKLQNLGYTLGGCNVSQIAYPLYRKLKWKEYDLTRLVLIISSRSAVRRYISSVYFSYPIESIVNIILKVQKYLIKLLISVGYRKYNISRVDSFNEEFSDILKNNDITFGSPRSIEWYEWLLKNSFTSLDEVNKGLYAVKDGAGIIVGCFLFKQRFYKSASQKGFKNLLLASLQDWQIFDNAKISQFGLILLAINKIFEFNPDAIEVCTDNDQLQKYLKIIGLIPAGKLSIFIKPNSKSLLYSMGGSESGNSELRPVEGDNFFN